MNLADLGSWSSPPLENQTAGLAVAGEMPLELRVLAGECVTGAADRLALRKALDDDFGAGFGGATEAIETPVEC
jgi:hypothetical protein